MRNSRGFAQIILILIIVGVTIGGAYYFGTLKNKSGLSVVAPTPTSFVSPKPQAQADDPTANWKTYTKDNYQVKYPSDWSIVPLPIGFSIDQNNYKINIQTSNPGFGPGICIFSDSSDFNNPYTDNPILAASKCPGTFIETRGSQYTFRRKITQNSSPDGISTGNWSIYIKDSKGDFVTNPPIEYISPVAFNKATIELMDQILSTFKFTK